MKPGPLPPGPVPRVERRAVLVFGALVVLLLAPWPGWGRGFATAFSVYGNALVGLTSARVPPPRFEAPAPGGVDAADGGAWAVVLTMGERVVPLDTRIIAYTPLAIFLALALATTGSRRRKLLILGGGGAVLLLRLAFVVLAPLEAAPGSLVEIAWTILAAPPVMSYAAPLAVWWVAVALTTPRSRASSPRTGPRRVRAAARRA